MINLSLTDEANRYKLSFDIDLRLFREVGQMSINLTPTQQFVKDMTYNMFADFWYAMQARLQTDESLNRFLNPKGSLTPNEQKLCKNKQKLMAIKEVRARTSMNLKEAKDMVDDWCEFNNV